MYSACDIWVAQGRWAIMSLFPENQACSLREKVQMQISHKKALNVETLPKPEHDWVNPDFSFTPKRRNQTSAMDDLSIINGVSVRRLSYFILFFLTMPKDVAGIHEM